MAFRDHSSLKVRKFHEQIAQDKKNNKENHLRGHSSREQATIRLYNPLPNEQGDTCTGCQERVARIQIFTSMRSPAFNLRSVGDSLQCTILE